MNHSLHRRAFIVFIRIGRVAAVELVTIQTSSRDSSS